MQEMILFTYNYNFYWNNQNAPHKNIINIIKSFMQRSNLVPRSRFGSFKEGRNIQGMRLVKIGRFKRLSKS